MKKQPVQKRRDPAEPEQRQQRVERRAYELFLKRDQQPGYELEDWLKAEREVNEWSETQKFG